MRCYLFELDKEECLLEIVQNFAAFNLLLQFFKPNVGLSLIHFKPLQ